MWLLSPRRGRSNVAHGVSHGNVHDVKRFSPSGAAHDLLRSVVPNGACTCETGTVPTAHAMGYGPIAAPRLLRDDTIAVPAVRVRRVRMLMPQSEVTGTHSQSAGQSWQVKVAILVPEARVAQPPSAGKGVAQPPSAGESVAQSPSAGESAPPHSHPRRVCYMCSTVQWRRSPRRSPPQTGCPPPEDVARDCGS